MSFGFSASDFIVLVKLVNSTIESCRNGPKEYRAVRAETAALKTVLDQLHDQAVDPSSLLNRRGSERRDELLPLVKAAEAVVTDLNYLVGDKTMLDRDDKSVKKLQQAYRVGSSQDQIDMLTARLTFHVSCITAFLQSLEGAAISRIEHKLELIYEKIVGSGSQDNASVRNSETETSSLVSNAESVRSRLDADEEDVWRTVRRALADEGLAVSDLAAYRTEVIQYLRNLLDEDIDGVEDADATTPRDDDYTSGIHQIKWPLKGSDEVVSGGIALGSEEIPSMAWTNITDSTEHAIAFGQDGVLYITGVQWEASNHYDNLTCNMIFDLRVLHSPIYGMGVCVFNFLPGPGTPYEHLEKRPQVKRTYSDGQLDVLQPVITAGNIIRSVWKEATHSKLYTTVTIDRNSSGISIMAELGTDPEFEPEMGFINIPRADLHALGRLDTSIFSTEDIIKHSTQVAGGQSEEDMKNPGWQNRRKGVIIKALEENIGISLTKRIRQ